MERACTFEIVDDLAMQCHELDQSATLAKSVAKARTVRTDLGTLENLARTTFRAGELNEATIAAWERLRLPIHVQEAREKMSLASEAAQQRSGERASRFNIARTIGSAWSARPA